MDLQPILTHVTDIARETGAMLREAFEGPLKIDQKSGHFDIVTEADKNAEKLIVAALEKAYPDHHIVGEEGGSMGAPIEEADYRWYLDPIDGTTNFAGGIPHFCTSIAMADKHDRPLVGVVYMPYYDEMFTAARGLGATFNGEPMQVSENEDMITGVLVTSFNYKQTNPGEPNSFDEVRAFLAKARAVRYFGSAALDLCWVAAGRIEGFWEWGINPWDCQAGVLIVTEAGGTCSDFSGADTDKLYLGDEVMASNGKVHEGMVQTLAEVYRRA